MAGLLEPYIPNVGNWLQSATEGYKLGGDIRKRNLLSEAGGLAAGGNLKGARNTLYRGGELDEGYKADDRIIAATQRAKTESLEKAKRFNDMIGSLAMAADTPEKWAKAITTAKGMGLDVSKYADFGARDVALAQAGKTNEMLTLELNRRKADILETTAGAKAASQGTPLGKALAQRDAKAQQDYADQSQSAADLEQNVTGLESARERTNFEGSWFNNALTRSIGRNIGGGLGMVPTSKDVQALDQINSSASGLTMQAAEKLKGALSDRDLAFLQQAEPGGSMTDAAATQPLAIIKGGAIRAQIRAAMYDEWLQKHGSGRGFQEAWSRYSRDNTIVGQDKAGKPVYNVQPRTDWRQYLEADTSGAPPISVGVGANQPGIRSDPLGILD